jgi:hypothetical protein
MTAIDGFCVVELGLAWEAWDAAVVEDRARDVAERVAADSGLSPGGGQESPEKRRQP